VNELGIGFMLAASYHPAMHPVSLVTRAIEINTAFKFIGPMLNPAKVPYVVVGVCSKDLVSCVIIYMYLFFQ
jgi:anthranilate phosphoribosyltransferase